MAQTRLSICCSIHAPGYFIGNRGRLGTQRGRSSLFDIRADRACDIPAHPFLLRLSPLNSGHSLNLFDTNALRRDLARTIGCGIHMPSNANRSTLDFLQTPFGRQRALGRRATEPLFSRREILAQPQPFGSHDSHLVLGVCIPRFRHGAQLFQRLQIVTVFERIET